MKQRKGSHSWSILTGKERRCFVTGRTSCLQKHHIFHGNGKRKISDRHGFWCYLVPEVHLAELGGLHAYPESGNGKYGGAERHGELQSLRHGEIWEDASK